MASRKAQIESLWATGMAPKDIAPRVGSSLDYTQQVCRLILAHSKLENEPRNDDDDKHFALVCDASLTGFPFYRRVPI